MEYLSTNTQKTFLCTIVATSILGPAFSYSSLYLFHLVAIAFFFYFFLFLLINKKLVVNTVFLLFLCFYIYAALTVFLVNNFTYYYANLFYLSCGLTLILAHILIIQSSYDIFLERKILLWLGGLQIGLGLVEVLGWGHFPTSPYSDYGVFFGHSNDFIYEWPDAIRKYNLSKPVGFTGNPNTFGFVVLLFTPFLLCLPLRYKFFSSIVVFFLIYTIDSKSLFVAYLLTFIFYIFFFKKSYLPFLIAFVLILLSMFMAFDFSTSSGRMFTVLSEIHRGATSIISGDFSNDSTGLRAHLYSYALGEFFNTYGLGLGLGGIESALSEESNGAHVALHNFYLQLLTDLGVLGFVLFSTFYVLILRYLYAGYKHFSETSLENIYKSLFLSMLVAIFSSIAPSGIFYNLVFWCLIGYSVALIKFYCKSLSGKSHLNARALY